MHFQATIRVKFVGFDIVWEETGRQAFTLEEILYGGGGYEREEKKESTEQRYGCQSFQRKRHCLEDFERQRQKLGMLRFFQGFKLLI